MSPDSASHPSEADVAFMRLALVEATAALERQEVPIGCVLVDESGRVVAKGSNRTNEKRDATRHAELEAFDALRASDSGREEGDPAVIVGNGGSCGGGGGGGGGEQGNGGGGKGEGGRLEGNDGHNSPRSSFPRSSLRNLTLYVTCEPCVMCAAALSILRPKRVVFGCHNPRFGGVGSVLDVVKGRFPGCGLRHEIANEENEEELEEEGAGRGRQEEEEEAGTSGENGGGGGGGGGEEKAASLEGETANATSSPRVGGGGGGGAEKPNQPEENHLSSSSSSLRTARPYRTLGGVLAAEAIALLKEFYETGNPSAPRPNRPAAAAATRAARKAAVALAAAEEAARAAAAAAAASNGGGGAAT